MVNFEVHSGYEGPFRSVPVHSGPFLLVNAPERPELLERPPKYRKDQRIIGNHILRIIGN